MFPSHGQTVLMVYQNIIYLHEKDHVVSSLTSLTKQVSQPKGFGSSWEQTRLPSRGHRKAGITAGKTFPKSNLITEEITKRVTFTLHVFFQILNAEKNLLKTLPDSIGDLRLLQTLNLKGALLSAIRQEWVDMRKSDNTDHFIILFPSLCTCIGNSLSELPSSIGSLSSLRTLDLSDNSIVQLPKSLANIRTLEVCVFTN